MVEIHSHYLLGSHRGVINGGKRLEPVWCQSLVVNIQQSSRKGLESIKVDDKFTVLILSSLENGFIFSVRYFIKFLYNTIIVIVEYMIYV